MDDEKRKRENELQTSVESAQILFSSFVSRLFTSRFTGRRFKKQAQTQCSRKRTESAGKYFCRKVKNDGNKTSQWFLHHCPSGTKIGGRNSPVKKAKRNLQSNQQKCSNQFHWTPFQRNPACFASFSLLFETFSWPIFLPIVIRISLLETSTNSFRTLKCRREKKQEITWKVLNVASYRVPGDVQTITDQKNNETCKSAQGRLKIGALVVLGGYASKYLQAKTHSLRCTKKGKTKKNTNEVVFALRRKI